MKKILLAVSVLFLSSASYANNAVEQQIVPINEVVEFVEQAVDVEKPVLRNSDAVEEVKTIVEDSVNEVQQVVTDNEKYNADTEYLLEKIESFTPIDINKKVIIKTIDESEVKSYEEVADEIKSVVTPVVGGQNSVLATPNQVKYEDKVAMTRLYCKFYSAAVLKQPKTNLTWFEKNKLRKYYKSLAQKSFGSIYYSGSRKSIVRIKVVIDRNGKVTKTKVLESSYNKDFNKQIIQQLKDMQLPPFDISVEEIVGVYQFDNVKRMNK